VSHGPRAARLASHDDDLGRHVDVAEQRTQRAEWRDAPLRHHFVLAGVLCDTERMQVAGENGLGYSKTSPTETLAEFLLAAHGRLLEELLYHPAAFCNGHGIHVIG
jgi:hypothetical protein